MNFSFFWKHAGIITIWTDTWTFHAFPSQRFRSWGHSISWCDGPIEEYGLGLLALIVLHDDSKFQNDKNRCK